MVERSNQIVLPETASKLLDNIYDGKDVTRQDLVNVAKLLTLEELKVMVDELEGLVAIGGKWKRLNSLLDLARSKILIKESLADVQRMKGDVEELGVRIEDGEESIQQVIDTNRGTIKELTEASATLARARQDLEGTGTQ